MTGTSVQSFRTVAVDRLDFHVDLKAYGRRYEQDIPDRRGGAALRAHAGDVALLRRHSVLTAAGGLASTVFAPLTAALTDALGWRAAIAVLATAVSALTGIVHLCCLPGRSARPPDLAAGADHQAPLTRDLRPLRTAVLVEQTAYVATSAQLVGFLTARAVPLHTASAVLGTMGPRPGRIRSRRQPLRSDHQRLVATTAERRIRGIRMFRRQGSSVRRVAHVQSRSRSTAWLTWE
jgi:hypothetical protein